MPCGNGRGFAQKENAEKVRRREEPSGVGIRGCESAIPTRRYSMCIESSLLFPRQQSLDIFLKPVFVDHADISGRDPTFLVNEERVRHIPNAVCFSA